MHIDDWMGMKSPKQSVRRTRWRSRTLIALTGWGQEADRTRAPQAGFDHHIVKPREISRLQTLLAGAWPAHGLKFVGRARTQ
jgi:CheY-like chemotaxis protein